MGLLLINKAITNVDDYPMYFSNMPEKTLFKKANTYNKNPALPTQYINIGNNQGVFIIEDGKITDFCFSEGVYYIEEASSPAFIFGRCETQTVDIDIFTNANFSFLGSGRQCVFINFKPINNITVFPETPIEYKFNGETFMVDFSSTFSVKISNPFILFSKIVNNDDGEYCVTDSFVDKLTKEFLNCILDELSICSQNGIKPDLLYDIKEDIINNAANNVSFPKAVNLTLVDVRMDDIGFVFDEEEIIEEPEPDMKRFSQFSVQPMIPIEMPLEYVDDNKTNASPMAIEDTDFNVETLNFEDTSFADADAIKTVEDYDDVSFDFSAYEAHHNVKPEENQTFVQQPPKQEFQQYAQVPFEEQNDNQPQQITIPQSFLFPQQAQPHTVETTIHSMQIQPAHEEPKQIDVGLEGFDLSFSNMSVAKPTNTSQNATIFSPFGDDDEWLCPNCLNEAIGDFCGFCGQRRATPFKVVLNQSNNSGEWMCKNCGTQNFLKFCSNCGLPKPNDIQAKPTHNITPKFCPSCGYDFANINSVPKFCPECGLKF